MKLIVAIIQPQSFPNVKKSLLDVDIKKMTVSNVLGCGQQAGFEESYRGVISEVNLLKKIKIEIAVNDKYVKSTIDAIIQAAKTGNIGDGKIMVFPIEDCIRVRTEESGKDAI